MTTLTLDTKYVDILQVFGTLEETVEEAIQDYATRRTNELIETARQEVLAFEAKYGMTYEEFFERTMEDDEFVTMLWETTPLWKIDFSAWEYYVEELAEWRGRLKNISKN